MVKTLIDLLEFLMGCAPLLTSLAILSLPCILLSKSIKKHPTAYYIAFGIPFVLVAIPVILRWCGVEMTFSFTRLPILGQILRDYIHMGTFGHPLLIIIMYMGALETSVAGVKKLRSIRKELSIISGFPVLTHSLIRVANNFPNSLKFFTNHADYIENTRVASQLGTGISSFSLVLGIIMLAIFLPLWVTSFDRVHKRMGAVRWKKLQRWSYVLYATLFIHAMGIQIGGLLNPRGGGEAPKAAVATTAAEASSGREASSHPAAWIAEGERTGENARPAAGREGHTTRATQSPEGRGQNDPQATAAPSGGGRAQAKGFTDIRVSSRTKGYIHIVSLLLVYASYLYLRVRKARRDSRKRSAAKT